MPVDAPIELPSNGKGRGPKPPRPKQQPSFEVCKRNALSKLDKSPKGSLDEPTAPLVHDINRHPDYVTTSSCSGRVALFATFGEERNRGGRWLLVQHATVTIREVTDALTPPPTQPAAPPPELVLFKHEPGILHVQCRHLEAAKRLLQVALSAGFRESGLVLSGSEKVMLAIRTTSNSLELPLASRGVMLLPPSYMELLVTQANERFASNRGRTDALHAAFLADAADAAARCAECAPSASTPSASAPSAPASAPASVPTSAPVAPKAEAAAPSRTVAAAEAAAEAAAKAAAAEAAAAALRGNVVNDGATRGQLNEDLARSRSEELASFAQQVQEGAASLARAERQLLTAQSKAAAAQRVAQGLAVAVAATAVLLAVGAVRVRA